MFDEERGTRTGETASEARDDDVDAWVRCAACGAPLAPLRAAIPVDGAHEHAFVNPAGIRFLVRCFATAPGTRPDGERSAVWTWFPGREWQVSLCASCRSHVGWSFHGPPSSGNASAFWALIADRLA